MMVWCATLGFQLSRPSEVTTPRRTSLASILHRESSMCASGDDLSSLTVRARDALRTSTQHGLHAVRLRVAVPALDPIGASYNPRAFARFTMAIAQVLDRSAPMVVLLPGPSACSEMMALLSSETGSSSLSVCQLSVATLSLAPESDDKPRTVIMAGPSTSRGADDRSTVHARQWLQLARGGRTTVVVLNARYSSLRAEPVELRTFTTVFAHITRCCWQHAMAEGSSRPSSLEACWLGDEDCLRESPGEQPVVAVLARRYPDPWRVLLDTRTVDNTRGDGSAHLADINDTRDKARDGAYADEARDGAHADVADDEHGAWLEIASLAQRPSAAALDQLVAQAIITRRAAQRAIDEVATELPRTAMPMNAAPRRPSSSNGEGSVWQVPLALSWRDIQADGPVGGGLGSAMDLYNSACLLRLRCLPVHEATFTSDRHALHLILPGDELVSRPGAALGACLLLHDAAASGVARIAQLSVDASAGGSSKWYARRLLQYAQVHAARADQQWLVSASGGWRTFGGRASLLDEGFSRATDVPAPPRGCAGDDYVKLLHLRGGSVVQSGPLDRQAWRCKHASG